MEEQSITDSIFMKATRSGNTMIISEPNLQEGVLIFEH